MKLLLIDDSIDLGRVLQKILTHRGMEVVVAQDGKAGLRLALSDTFDLILLDLMMPQMDGYTVLRHLRAEGRGVPVMVLTAKEDDSDFIKALELGADDYLQKPFSMDILMAKIRALVRRARGAEEDALSYADLTLSEHILAGENHRITLSEEEEKIFSFMIQNSAKVLPEEKLLEAGGLSEEDAERFGRDMAHLSAILPALSRAAKIFYIKGVGYKLCAGI